MKTIIVYDINLSPEAQPMDTEIGSEYRRVSTMLYTLSARGARVKYLNLRDMGMVLGYGCGTPAMTRASRYPKEAYALGRGL